MINLPTTKNEVNNNTLNEESNNKIENISENSRKEFPDNSSFEEKIIALHNKLANKPPTAKYLTANEKLLILSYLMKRNGKEAAKYFNLHHSSLSTFRNEMQLTGITKINTSKYKKSTESEGCKALSEWIKGDISLFDLKKRYGVCRTFLKELKHDLGLNNKFCRHTKQEKREIMEYAVNKGKQAARKEYGLKKITLTQQFRTDKNINEYDIEFDQANSIRRFLPLINKQLEDLNTEYIHQQLSESWDIQSKLESNEHISISSNILTNNNVTKIPKDGNSRNSLMKVNYSPNKIRDLNSSYKTVQTFINLHELLNEDEKLAIVDLANYDLIEEISECYKIDKYIIRKWVSRYKKYGKSGLNMNLKAEEIDKNVIKEEIAVNNQREYGYKLLAKGIIEYMSNAQNINPNTNLAIQITKILGKHLPVELMKIQEKLWKNKGTELLNSERIYIVKYILGLKSSIKEESIYFNLSSKKLTIWCRLYRRGGEERLTQYKIDYEYKEGIVREIEREGHGVVKKKYGLSGHALWLWKRKYMCRDMRVYPQKITIHEKINIVDYMKTTSKTKTRDKYGITRYMLKVYCNDVLKYRQSGGNGDVGNMKLELKKDMEMDTEIDTHASIDIDIPKKRLSIDN